MYCISDRNHASGLPQAFWQIKQEHRPNNWKKSDKNSCSKVGQIEGSNDKMNDVVALLITNCQSNNTISKKNGILT